MIIIKIIVYMTEYPHLKRVFIQWSTLLELKHCIIAIAYCQYTTGDSFKR